MPFYNQLLASLQIYRSLEDVGLVKGFYYRVQETLEEDLIPVDSITKVFCLNNIFGSEKECFMVKLCTSFEHS